MYATRKFVGACLVVLLGSTASGIAQNTATGNALTVEHSIPFGTVMGKLLLLGNYVVFVDEQQPNASFVIPRGGIESLKADGANVTIQTKEPIRNRSGEYASLSFRVAPGADPGAVTSWYGSGVTARAPAPASVSAVASPGASANAPAASVPGATTYQVRHSHLFGDCRGTLIVAPNQVSFESISAVSHSRRWEYQAIKETELTNPYELEIEPFAGDTYKLRFDGSGMDPAAYKSLVDRITSARATR